jgi:hypothetical protein
MTLAIQKCRRPADYQVNVAGLNERIKKEKIKNRHAALIHQLNGNNYQDPNFLFLDCAPVAAPAASIVANSYYFSLDSVHCVLYGRRLLNGQRAARS